MTAQHVEARFESAIEASMLAAGWHRGSSDDHPPALGLAVEQPFAFLTATHPTAWAEILGSYGEDDTTGRTKHHRHGAQGRQRAGSQRRTGQPT